MQVIQYEDVISSLQPQTLKDPFSDQQLKLQAMLFIMLDLWDLHSPILSPSHASSQGVPVYGVSGPVSNLPPGPTLCYPAGIQIPSAYANMGSQRPDGMVDATIPIQLHSRQQQRRTSPWKAGRGIGPFSGPVSGSDPANAYGGNEMGGSTGRGLRGAYGGNPFESEHDAEPASRYMGRHEW